MDKLKKIVFQKRQEIIGFTFIYIIFVYIIKWKLSLSLEGLWFILGSLVGLFIIDIFEELVNITPTPFKSIIFYSGFIAVSLFVTTSSGSVLAIGMVLALYITLIGNVIFDFKKNGNISNYLTNLTLEISVRNQEIMIIFFVIIFIIESVIFFR